MKEFTQGGRITSLHGILLPPKKKLVVKKYVTVRFVLVGTIPSKKNMIWADSNFNLLSVPATAKTIPEYKAWLKENLNVFIRNSKKYKDWVEEQSPVILKQAAKEAARYKDHGLIFPLTNTSVKVYHYWADNQARDNSNKYDSIIDLLVACKILQDDRWQNVTENASASECYHGEILDHITTIDITQRFI